MLQNAMKVVDTLPWALMLELMVAGGILPPGIELNCIAFNTIPGGRDAPGHT